MRDWREQLLGLDKGFLDRPGESGMHFNPPWPEAALFDAGAWNWVLGLAALGVLFYLFWRKPVSKFAQIVTIIGRIALIAFLFTLLSGAFAWNAVLALLAGSLLVYVYYHEGRSTPVRVMLGSVRALLLILVISLLNRPVLTLSESHIEPSVVAILIDDSISMRVRDALPDGASAGNTDESLRLSRLDAARQLLEGDNGKLVRELAKVHILRIYSFGQSAESLTSIGQINPDEKDAPDPVATLSAALAKMQPNGQSTQVLLSLKDAMQDMQGQRLAGVIVLTDGRETPQRPQTETLAAIKNFGVKVYPVAVGSEEAPTNIAIQSVYVQDSAFAGDIVNVKATVRGSGYEPGHAVTLVLKDAKTGRELTPPEGTVPQKVVQLADDSPVEVELQFKTRDVGLQDIVVEAVKQKGEIDDADNLRLAQVDVLEAKIAVLYVEGYPRWDYRYIKNEMIRDKTVNISCWLISGLGIDEQSSFIQEGDDPDPTHGFPGAITRFPNSIEEFMAYDVVLFGDVDPRQITDVQYALISEFVSKKGGGFGMVAGPKWSPQAYRNTAIEAILPVNISRVVSDVGGGAITQGFRPVLTTEGTASSIFRFFTDKAINEKFLREDIQPVFWYCQGVTVKDGVGIPYAEHPSDMDGENRRKAPILVLGRFGAGRTLFSAIDDSWRWRFYTGESIFDTYWVQQLRYLARSKKLGQRRLTFTASRSTYELGEQVKVSLWVLDPQLLQQLPEQLSVEIVDENNQRVRQLTLMRQEGQTELYTASFTADRVGKFNAKLPPIAGAVDAIDLKLEVAVPKLELTQPQIDRGFLTRIASQTDGQTVEYADARVKLPAVIQSARRIIPAEASQPLWDAPLAMGLFLLLITFEWVMRKMFGML